MLRRPLRRRARAPETIAQAFLDSPAALVIADARLRIVAANRAYRRLQRRRGATPPGMLSCVHCDGAPATLSAPLRTGCAYEIWRYRAEHDALTGLPNRDHLESALARALARAGRHAQRLAVLFVDLDGFKAINDGHGHASGDRLIRRIGTRLRDTLRAEDLVARYGGDEFVVLLEEPRQAADAAAAASALLEAVREVGTDAEAGAPAVTASIGVALFPDHARDAAGLLKVADAAMYGAKRAGGDTYAFGGPSALSCAAP